MYILESIKAFALTATIRCKTFRFTDRHFNVPYAGSASFKTETGSIGQEAEKQVDLSDDRRRHRVVYFMFARGIRLIFAKDGPP
ncbi:hypothetical protein GCM10007362_28280 [Saccharibacillus endophyticus]|uniref:Uncharacterized protein n=1 Tax=Saccharibacillus endophyticus TaxID=2060666 RepID=A0ABQ1ZVB0_9BACL|nr:hypothetical protein GCM10007362_28280 [Saccharibacillus endophyticus]